MRVTQLLAAIFVSSVAAALSGCGSSSGPALPTIAPAKTFRLEGFTPAGPVRAGRPTELGLRIMQPSGAPLTRYRTGAGPHTGIDLLIVPSDLRTLYYEDPPIAKDGSIRQTMTFPVAGAYRVVVDAFPDTPGVAPNIQLFRTIDVTGSKPARTPRFGLTARDGGYRFAIQGRPSPTALQADFLTVKVTDAHGTPVVFTPFDGALAHAVFFREGTLDYFHSHVCTPDLPACTGAITGPVGSATKPGILRIGALLPAAGTWRMFLRTKIAGRELITPFTLSVR